MLYQFFSQIIHMSIIASVVIVAVLLIRGVMYRMPKKYLYLLWVIVGIRLICPVAVSSPFSLFNIVGQGEMDFQGKRADAGGISGSGKSDMVNQAALVQPQLKGGNSAQDGRNTILREGIIL